MHSDLAGYRAGLLEGELRVPHCPDCGKWWWPPRAHCIHCGSCVVQWRKAPGEATIFSWTVIQQSSLPGFKDRVPYVVAVLSFEQIDVRIIGFIDDAPDAIEVGGRYRPVVLGGDCPAEPPLVWRRVDEQVTR